MGGIGLNWIIRLIAAVLLLSTASLIAQVANQHVKVSPSSILQHAVERRAACLRAAEPVVYIFMFGYHAQPTALRIFAEFS